MKDNDFEFIKMAIAEASKCQGEDDRSHPKVGAIVVRDGVVLGTAHRGELLPGEHAEFTALEKKLGAESLVGATVYTTLEPCTTRNHPKVPCAHRLVERRVRRVVIGMLDPNDRICGRGLWHLRESGIQTDLFSHEHMAAVEELNREFIRIHRPKLHPPIDDTLSNTAIAAPPKDTPENKEWKIVTTLVKAAENCDFAAAEAALKELQSERQDEEAKQRLQLLFWELKARYAQDTRARAELEKAAGHTGNGALATELLASLEESAGNTHAAIEILTRAIKESVEPDAKATFALRTANICREADNRGLAIETLRSVVSLEISPRIRAQVLRALADVTSGETASIQKAALLSRAATLDPSHKNQFDAAYALADADLTALSALHYEFALNASPSDEASLNNLGVAFERLSLHGMSVQQYQRAAEAGGTLAMANLAQRYITQGFFREAEEQIKCGRLSESPHQNIGAAMMALEQARKTEAEKWNEQRKIALGHKRFLSELADALATELKPDALVGPWTVGKEATMALTVAGTAVEAAWEDSSEKRQLRASLVGRALVGTLEAWNTLWKHYESKSTVCLVLRENGSLSGLLISTDGSLRTLEWHKTG